MEDLGWLKVKDPKNILTAYNENVSGGKADLTMRVCDIFSCVTSHSAATSDFPTSSVYDILVAAITYNDICSQLSWDTDLRSTPLLTFIQLYAYLVIVTVKYHSGPFFVKFTNGDVTE